LRPQPLAKTRTMASRQQKQFRWTDDSMQAIPSEVFGTVDVALGVTGTPARQAC
jgi:hypothetical protein